MKCPFFTLFPCFSSLLCNLLCRLLLEPLQLSLTTVSTRTNFSILPLRHVSLYLMLKFSFLCWLMSHNSVLCYFSGCFRILTYTCDLPAYLHVVSATSQTASEYHGSTLPFPPSQPLCYCCQTLYVSMLQTPRTLLFFLHKQASIF